MPPIAKAWIVPIVIMTFAAILWAQPQYSFTDIGTLGGKEGTALGINTRGEVVGGARTADDSWHAFRTSPNRPINPATDDLAPLGNLITSITAINDAGVMAGTVTLSGSLVIRNALGIPAGATIDLATHRLWADDSESSDINDAGQVAGTIYGSGAFRTRPSVPLDLAVDALGTLGGHDSSAHGINGLGQVVGASSIAGGPTHAFRTAPNAKINPLTDDLGTLGGQWSVAYDVNDRGEAVGYAATPDGGGTEIMHAFKTRPNAIIAPGDDLGTLGGVRSLASSINEYGDVVGWYETVDAQQHHHQRAFGYIGSTMYDLTEIAAPLGWTLGSGNDINELGQIVGFGFFDPDGEGGIAAETRAFLLTPIPEPRLMIWIVVVAFGLSRLIYRHRRTLHFKQ
jgi:probable HAF family extracellular repeat protein